MPRGSRRSACRSARARPCQRSAMASVAADAAQESRAFRGRAPAPSRTAPVPRPRRLRPSGSTRPSAIVAVRLVRRERDRPLAPPARAARARSGVGDGVGVEQRPAGRDPPPRERELRVEGHGLLVVGERPREADRVVGARPRPSLLALEKGVVRGDVLRGLLGELFSCSSASATPSELGDLRRDVRLHLEHVRQRRVEGLLPLRRRRPVSLDLDELRIDLDAAGAVRLSASGPSRSAGSWAISSRAISCGVLVVFL